MLQSTVSKVLGTVPRLKPIAERVASGAVKVEQRDLESGIHALYVSTPGTFAESPELHNIVLLNSDDSWDLDESLYDRSVLVHEGYHALDDLELAGQSTGYLDAECRAWKGQAAYLAEELARTESTPDPLVKEMVAGGMGDLEKIAMALALRAAPVTAGALPVASTLEERLLGSLENATGVEELFEEPEKSLKGSLAFIYFTPPEATFELDGIAQ